MLWEIIKATFVAVCLAVFSSVNLHNILKWQLSKNRGARFHAEIQPPRGLAIALASLGTLVFFIGSVLYCALVFTGYIHVLNASPFQLRFPFNFYIEVSGIALTGAGYVLFIWSVLARGKYATSWAMPENHKLVTWGPYRYVRHPSYLAYFLMFSGLFLVMAECCGDSAIDSCAWVCSCFAS